MAADDTPAKESPEELKALREQIRAWALELGFDAAGFAPAVVPPGYGHYQEWLAAGHEAGMAYMRRQEAARRHPSSVLEPVATVIVVMLNYRPGGDLSKVGKPSSRHGRVAAYARGVDYHGVFWQRLEGLLGKIKAERPDVQGRAVCDSAPLMERDYACLAGLGWVGKNTCMISRKVGSMTLLGSLLVDLPLPPDEPFTADHCGTCTRCLDACPTDAFGGPGQLDARKCISYWTIEHKGPWTEETPDSMHGWVFGCDVCQEVCPWNRKSPVGQDLEVGSRAAWAEVDLLDWLKMEPEAFRRMIRGTALERTKRAGLLRNAMSILVEEGDPAAVTEIRRLAESDPDEKVRQAAEEGLAKLNARGGDL
ncbi:MAG: tRNA epoxyqueuosine(34) reductase QueG, partial [bacterium]